MNKTSISIYCYSRMLSTYGMISNAWSLLKLVKAILSIDALKAPIDLATDILNGNLMDRLKDIHLPKITLSERQKTLLIAAPAVGLLTVVLYKVLSKPSNKHSLSTTDSVKIEFLLDKIFENPNDKSKLIVYLNELDSILNSTKEGKRMKNQLIIELRKAGILKTGFFKGITDIK